MALPKDKRLNLSRLKGYKGYVLHGFKRIAEKYDDVDWGEGTLKPKKIEALGPGKTRITF